MWLYQRVIQSIGSGPCQHPKSVFNRVLHNPYSMQSARSLTRTQLSTLDRTDTLALFNNRLYLLVLSRSFPVRSVHVTNTPLCTVLQKICEHTHLRRVPAELNIFMAGLSGRASWVSFHRSHGVIAWCARIVDAVL